MPDKKTKAKRRHLLKSIAAGSGMLVAGKSIPESWNRPVVDAVMLPAHAQTTTMTFFSSNIRANVQLDQEPESRTEKLLAKAIEAPLSMLVGPAQAQPSSEVLCIRISGTSYQVDYQVQNFHYTGSGTIGEAPKKLDTPLCDYGYADFTVTSISGNVANVLMCTPYFEGPIPLASCNFDFGCIPG